MALYVTAVEPSTKEANIQKDIEYALHDDTDKVLLSGGVIKGSINITSIEEGIQLSDTTNGKNGKNGYPTKNGAAKDVKIKNGVVAPVKNVKTQPVVTSDASLETREEKNTPQETREEKKEKLKSFTIRQLWKKRNARSIEEGIRRESGSTTTSTSKLSSLLKSVLQNRLPKKEERPKRERSKRKYGARTIAGLIVALAEEADGLDVEVDARRDTPLWGKHVDAVTINFTRLGFKPLRMGGLDQAIRDLETSLEPSEKNAIAYSLNPKLRRRLTAAEAFDRIDVDKSGALDQEELAEALSLAAGIGTSPDTKSKRQRTKELLSGLASRLINLYDANGDGVVDREEYQTMVEDMAVLRRAQKERSRLTKDKSEEGGGFGGWRKALGKGISTGLKNLRGEKEDDDDTSIAPTLAKSENRIGMMKSSDTVNGNVDNTLDENGTYDLANDPSLLRSVTGQGEGSIVLSDLKLDLRRLLFGAVPFVKKITPGGPLILEPFTMTATGSFSTTDVMESNLLDAGLRRLVARALSRRVRSLRDLLDGAVFYGRTWNLACKTAPYVEVPKLENVEFDNQGRMIITGRARIRAKPDAPFVDNAFKLRTRLGTREDGQVIRLQDAEIALVLECPKAWERNIVSACKRLNLPIPEKPKPIYSYIPLVSPLKKNDKDGFNLGDDNKIKSIEVRNGALCFELSAVLRPGRFLGNHFLAFSVPNRSFIITLDRVREGMREARKNKRARKAAMRAAEVEAKRAINEKYDAAIAQSIAADKDLSKAKDDLNFIDPDAETNAQNTQEEPVEEENEKKGFFGRFVEGYSSFDDNDDDEEEVNERMFAAISDWFGRQDTEKDDVFDDDDIEDDTTEDNR